MLPNTYVHVNFYRKLRACYLTKLGQLDPLDAGDALLRYTFVEEMVNVRNMFYNQGPKAGNHHRPRFTTLH